MKGGLLFLLDLLAAAAKVGGKQQHQHQGSRNADTGLEGQRTTDRAPNQEARYGCAGPFIVD